MKSEYTTIDDFSKLFTEDMNSLYLLSFLLTGNQEEAERSFVSGLADCVNGNPVFKQWARSWARSIIVRNAIRIRTPQISRGRWTTSASDSANEEPTRMPLEESPFARVLALDDFERFVYVLSVLERYSVRKCADLLGTSIQDILEKRLLALQHMVEFANGDPVRHQLVSQTMPPSDPHET
jgi:hypothetical protein